jgi:hypothetical protein
MRDNDKAVEARTQLPPEFIAAADRLTRALERAWPPERIEAGLQELLARSGAPGPKEEGSL